MNLPSGKGVYVWNQSTCLAALKTLPALAQFIKDLGCTWVAPKIGNGYYAWPNLEAMLDAFKDAGLYVCGWWFNYGNDGEAAAMRTQVTRHKSRLDAFAHDAEVAISAARANLDCASVSAAAPELPQILNSWWSPKLHPEQPFPEWFKHVDAIMPQVYPMGDPSTLGGVWRLDRSLAEYKALGWTGPFLVASAAFHEHGWSATVAQMDAAHKANRDRGARGEAWWLLDQMLSDNNVAFLDAIRAHSWDPAVPEPTDADKLATLWAWYRETHAE
jgi:hypothetical protein